MKKLQTKASFVSLSTFIIVIVTFLIGSCASYQMPLAISPNDSRIVGTYVYDDESEERIKLTLYEDGYFHEYVYYYENDEWFSDVGTYFIQPDSLTVEFYYALDEPTWNYTARLDEAYNFVIIDDIELQRLENPKHLSNIEDASQIPGVYVLSYVTDEPVILELTLSSDGRFKERSFYPDSEKMWTEHGKYDLSLPSGFITFEYEDWPEGTFSGILNAVDGVLHSVEGDYIRTNDKPGDGISEMEST